MMTDMPRDNLVIFAVCARKISDLKILGNCVENRTVRCNHLILLETATIADTPLNKKLKHKSCVNPVH